MNMLTMLYHSIINLPSHEFLWGLIYQKLKLVLIEMWKSKCLKHCIRNQTPHDPFTHIWRALLVKKSDPCRQLALFYDSTSCAELKRDRIPSIISATGFWNTKRRTQLLDTKELIGFDRSFLEKDYVDHSSHGFREPERRAT